MDRKHIVLMFVEPAAGRESDLSGWIDERFVTQALKLDAVHNIQHFAARTEFLSFPPPPGREVMLIELNDDASDDDMSAFASLVSAESLPDSAQASALRLSSLKELRPEHRRDGLADDLLNRQPRDLLVFYLGAVAGREDEYHEWYDRAHIRDGITLPGFVTGQRFAREAHFADLAPAPSEFVALYEIAGEGIDTAIEAAKASASRFEHSHAADTATMHAYALESSGPRLSKQNRAADV